MEATIRAMKRIADIKHKREVDFYSYRCLIKNILIFLRLLNAVFFHIRRFRGNRRREKAAALRELQQNISLIEAPASLRKKATVEITAVAPTKKKTITNKKKSASQQMQD